MKLKATTTTKLTPPAPSIKAAVRVPTSARVAFTKLNSDTLAPHTGKSQGGYQRSDSITYPQVTGATENSDPFCRA